MNKTTLTIENCSTMPHNLFLLDMSIFNGLAIKNYPLKKVTPFFVFMEGIQLPHNQVWQLEDRTFYRKVLSKLCCNSKFNI